MVPPERILVVDDEEHTRLALAELLGGEGFDVATASNGVEAIEQIQRMPPDLVLCDVRMPRADGLQVVQTLRHRSATANVPVIMVSASSEKERRVAALEMGADDFVAKPVDPDELMARIKVQLRHVHHQRELERRSSIDPLTGVLNRRGLMAELRREQARSERDGTPLSLLVIDVDGFKGINDRYGHQIGDSVLRILARSLADEVRSVDLVGRTGGDEFVVIAPHADAAAAARLKQRLLQLVVRVAVAPDSDVRVAFSVGDATLQQGEALDAVLDRADRAMYRSKRR
ncbi:MAG: diguanylate cyclase [Deltaproteobacteria bacterium]|nr:diguanylate cyclase [Kofleriaceae bacterium]